MARVNPLRAWCNRVDDSHTEAVLDAAPDASLRMAAMGFTLSTVTFPLAWLLYRDTSNFAPKDLALYVLHSLVYLGALAVLRLAEKHK